MRDYSQPLLEKFPWIVSELSGIHQSKEWFGKQGVYR